jgi:hypothetical protein
MLLSGGIFQQLRKLYQLSFLPNTKNSRKIRHHIYSYQLKIVTKKSKISAIQAYRITILIAAIKGVYKCISQNQVHLQTQIRKCLEHGERNGFFLA